MFFLFGFMLILAWYYISKKPSNMINDLVKKTNQILLDFLGNEIIIKK